MKKGVLLISLALLFCVGGLRVPPVYAVLFDFSNITSNNSFDAAIGETQLRVDVTDEGFNSSTGFFQALFTFQNIGPDFCSIAEIYFDDAGESLLLPINFPEVPEISVSIINSEPDVVFSEIDPKYWNFPSGGKNFEIEYGAGADEPPPQSGVNPYESLGILFDLVPVEGDDFSGLLSDIELGYTRIGMHVIAFASGGSESFINNPTRWTPRSVPEPSTMLLLGVGLIGLAGIGRKKFVKK